MIRLARNHPRNGSAHNVITGVVSTGATWSESFVIRDQDGENVVDIDDHDYQFQFRDEEDDTAAVLTLSGSEVTAAESNGVTTITINCAQSRLSSMSGGYVADLVSKSGSTLTHRGHGVVTFNNSPVAF
jgi:hypothetical protein